MATQWTPTTAGSAGSTPEPSWEEQAFLVGGPGRATEVAVVTLIEAGAVRISREGLVSAVGRPGHGGSPLQAHVLRSLPMPLGDVIAAAAWSAEAQSMRPHLVARGLITPPGRRKAARLVRGLLVAAAVATVIATIVLDLPFLLTFGAALAGVACSVVLGRFARPLTGAGRRVVSRLEKVAISPNRIALVACYGLLGKVVRNTHVWEVLGISPAAAATLRRRSRRGAPDGGGGCGSCSSSSCGGGGSSDSGGSSCGGGGCGGGGGGD